MGRVSGCLRCPECGGAITIGARLAESSDGLYRTARGPLHFDGFRVCGREPAPQVGNGPSAP